MDVLIAISLGMSSFCCGAAFGMRQARKDYQPLRDRQLKALECIAKILNDERETAKEEM